MSSSSAWTDIALIDEAVLAYVEGRIVDRTDLLH
jgi:hypothetical protein